jgi:hypothetical protein|tara:strand:+ start:1076 stop:1186 length:111 start_codon:yes stop_codon:yes gene_type:complete
MALVLSRPSYKKPIKSTLFVKIYLVDAFGKYAIIVV